MSRQQTAAAVRRESARLRRHGFTFEPDILGGGNIVEVLGPRPPQMSFGLYEYIFARGPHAAFRVGRRMLGYEVGAEANNGLFWLVNGEPRWSIGHDLLLYRIPGISPQEWSIAIDHYIARIEYEPHLAGYPQLGLYNQDPDHGFIRMLWGNRRVAPILRAYRHFFERLNAKEPKLERWFHAELVRQKNHLRQLISIPATDQQTLVRKFHRVIEATRQAGILLVVVGRLGLLGQWQLQQYLRGSGLDADKILRDWSTHLCAKSPQHVLYKDLRSVREGRLSLPEAQEKYAVLGSRPFDVAAPRYGEDTALLAALLQSVPVTAKTHEERGQGIPESLQPADTVVVQRIATFLPLRDIAQFHLFEHYNELRQILLAIEKSLGWPEELIWHLNPMEVTPAGLNRSKAMLARRRHRTPPKDPISTVLRTDQLLDRTAKTPSFGSMILRGIGGITTGTTMGKVVVLSEDAGPDAVSPGDIIVCRELTTGLYPLFCRVGPTGGVIAEIGGTASHGASLVRGLDLATVVSVAGARQIFNNNEMVRVDAKTGIITRLP